MAGISGGLDGHSDGPPLPLIREDEHALKALQIRLHYRNELTRLLLSGMKDLLVVAASVATLWITSETAGKVNLAAEAAVSSNAINTAWKAERTGDPRDAAKAAEAAARLDRVTPGMN